MQEAGFEGGFDVTLQAIAAPSRLHPDRGDRARAAASRSTSTSPSSRWRSAPSPRTSATAPSSGPRPAAACAAIPSGFVVDFRSGTANQRQVVRRRLVERGDRQPLRRGAGHVGPRRSAWRRISASRRSSPRTRRTSTPSSPTSSRWRTGGSKACTSRTRTSTRGCAPRA